MAERLYRSRSDTSNLWTIPDRTDRNRLAARLARKLGELGFDVTLTRREMA